MEYGTGRSVAFRGCRVSPGGGLHPALTPLRLGPSTAPPQPDCQNGKFTESSLVQISKLLLPISGSPSPSKIPAYTELGCKGNGGGGRALTTFLCTLPMFRKKIRLLGRAGHTGVGFQGRLSVHLCWLQNIYGSKHFLRKGEREMNLVAVVPLPLLPRFHGSGEGQDVAHSDLGGWQDRQLVNTSPSTPTPIQTAVPVSPQAHCLLCPSPSGAGISANWTQAGLAGNRI